MTPNERMVLERVLGTLNTAQVDLYVYSHMRTQQQDDRPPDQYNYRLLGQVILARRMLSELLGHPQDYLLPGEYCDEDTTLQDLLVYTPVVRSGYDDPLNDIEKRWLMKDLLIIMDELHGVSDSDDACFRCARREIAEVAGYPNLAHYRLMLENEVTPKFFMDYKVHRDFVVAPN